MTRYVDGHFGLSPVAQEGEEVLVRSLNPKVLQNIVFDMPNRVEELDER